MVMGANPRFYRRYPPQETIFDVAAQPARLASVLPFSFANIACRDHDSPCRISVASRHAPEALRIFAWSRLSATMLEAEGTRSTTRRRSELPAAGGTVTSHCGDFAAFHDHDQLGACLAALQREHSATVAVKSIGSSVQDREIWAVTLSADCASMSNCTRPVTQTRAIPDVVFYGNMHGDETLGREMSLRLARELAVGYAERIPRVVALLETTRIHILPSINPDGYELGQRSNARAVDLNRNFPAEHSCQFAPRSDAQREPETQHVMAFQRKLAPAFAANLHGGALVANYPLDDNANHLRKKTASDDDELFVKIAEAYAATHPTMGDSKEFENGAVNGASWYPVCGSIQDTAYVDHGTISLTLELGDIKSPRASSLQKEWGANKDALMQFAEGATRYLGAYGTVTGSGGDVSFRPYVRLGDNKRYPARADGDRNGLYLRYVPRTGLFNVTAGAHGYKEVTLANVLLTPGSPSEINFELVPASGSVLRMALVVAGLTVFAVFSIAGPILCALVF